VADDVLGALGEKAIHAKTKTNIKRIPIMRFRFINYLLDYDKICPIVDKIAAAHPIGIEPTIPIRKPAS